MCAGTAGNQDTAPLNVGAPPRGARAERTAMMVVEKEKEKTTKEKEKVKHTRQTAVNHSLPPKQDRSRSPQKVSINNKMMISIGHKIGGGLTVMPPQINNNGAKTVTGLNTNMIGSPSPTQNVSSPGWNPGTPLMFAKILSM